MELMYGGIDIHVHSSPSVAKRKEDDLEVAKKAKKAGMKGFVIKAHEGCSAARAYLTQKATKTNVYGGICLNSTVGGFNPEAVETSLKMGAKIVCFPTLSAANHKSFFPNPEGKKLGFTLKSKGEGLTILDSKGNIKKEVCQILELIQQHNAAVATGHLSLKEILLLVDNAINEFKVEKILFNHPDIQFISAPLKTQQELSRKGVIIEKCYVVLLPPWSVLKMDELAEMLKNIGPENCILASDLGQVENPSPPEGMQLYLQKLVEQGLSEKDIRTMWVNNPGNLIS